jgi:hypothetical protein
MAPTPAGPNASRKCGFWRAPGSSCWFLDRDGPKSTKKAAVLFLTNDSFRCFESASCVSLLAAAGVATKCAAPPAALNLRLSLPTGPLYGWPILPARLAPPPRRYFLFRFSLSFTLFSQSGRKKRRVRLHIRLACIYVRACTQTNARDDYWPSSKARPRAMHGRRPRP